MPADWPHGQGRWDERYTASVHHCAGCVALQRKQWHRSSDRKQGEPPEFGAYFAVDLDPEEG